MRRGPESLAAALSELDAQDLRRRRAVVEPRAPGASLSPTAATRVRVDGRDYVNFSSNDYLGLAAHPVPAAAMAACAAQTGAGAGASHLVTGHGPEHDALERELAEFTGRERALLFSTGYMANLGVASALADRDDLVLEDRLNHASLLDAGLLTRTRAFRRFPHGDAAAAESLLARHAAGRPGAGALLLTDGVFSMDGDLAPLPALARAATAHGAWLVVDDAHGFGVLGRSGGGCCEHFGLGSSEAPVLVGTLGKALGSFGAFVAGDADLIELMMQRARTYIYTTALPQPVAAATRAALRLLRSESWRRERLAERVARFVEGGRRRGLPLGGSSTPIQPIIVGSAKAALQAGATLREHGFWVTPIRPPTVPEGSARLRVTLSAAHEPAEVDSLLVALDAAWERAQAAREAPQ